MCGIVGQINVNDTIKQVVFNKMRDALHHRGPDDAGTYINKTKNIALGHRRLSFLDLSEKGKQPLCNNDNNIWITFNGEIYNFLELKTELKDFYNFKTNTDTEVIIAAYEKWGINCVNRLKGMFAFAILDERIGKLYLVRDRFGIKPLYYFKSETSLIFASELKALFASEIPKRDIDFSSFCDYFVYRYIPSPKTIWQHIYKVPPAHYLEISTDNLSIKEVEYWQLKSKESGKSEKDLIDEIDKLLSSSIAQHNRADVPIGSFLSGGYDSSAIVSYLVKQGEKPPTFSIGFENWQNSEDNFAKIVANHLGVPNKSVIANENSLDLIELMPQVYDEPIADISIIPTYMVSRLARENVKAVMSGEGADELFGGYTWQKEFFAKNYPKNWFNKIKALFQENNTVAFYAQAMAMGWFDADELKKMLHPRLHNYIPKDVHWFYRKHYRKELSPLKSIQYMDIKCFMGELVLTKIDRASMANSLEVRVPFLDHELFEDIFNTKEQTYFKQDKTKYVLLENIKGNLPEAILERKKQGFVGPDSYYMNKNWYKNQLKNSILVKNKIIRQEYIDSLLKEDYDWRIWKILVMEKWFEKWNEKA